MATKSTRRVMGLGGIFIRARNPDKLSEWYGKRLGIPITNNVAIFTWRSPKKEKQKGYTVWSVFPKNTKYFGARERQFMVNYRVKNLKQLLRKLRQEGVDVADKVDESKYGKFGWVTDPEGNRIELWEPPKTYGVSEDEMPME